MLVTRLKERENKIKVERERREREREEGREMEAANKKCLLSPISHLFEPTVN
jgi:hypothetical protein